MNPHDWVALADRMLSGGIQDEAEWRSAARGCYYAVYHVCAPYFGLAPDIKADHKDIRDRLSALQPGPRIPPHIIAARNCFVSLWRLRVRADYHIGTPFSADEADQALGYAQRVFRTLR